MKPAALTSSKRYTDFIAGRDRALGDILNKYLSVLDKTITALKIRCKEVAAHISTENSNPISTLKNRKLFEARIHSWFELAAYNTVDQVTRLRKTSYGISHMGQAEAIGRALGKKTKFHLDSHAFKAAANKEMTHGGTLHARTELAYSRLMHKVIEAFHSSQVLESGLMETLDRIDRAFPPAKKRKRLTKVMAKMKERELPDLPDSEFEDNDFDGFASGVINPDDWENMVDDYLIDEVPVDRSPLGKMFFGNSSTPENDSYVYAWQVEQEVTDDFVSQVRDGEIDAANQNGINDFQWIAVVDNKTDDCCLWRDGLTTTEISAQLNGEHSHDDCDATTPPAHFNCRCRVAPMTKDIPDETPTDFGSFDDWLDQKAKEAP